MFSMKKDTLLFEQMKQWIEQGENDKVKFIIKHTAPADLLAEYHETMLHVAASRGNLHIMEYLESIGFEIDVRDLYNATPLKLAIFNRQWTAVTFLLERNADVLAVDDLHETPLSQLMKMHEPDAEILKVFFDRVKSKHAGRIEFLSVLGQAGCTLDKIIHLRDAEVTKTLLTVSPFADAVISLEAEYASVCNAMRLMDEENMRVLVHYGEFERRREDFLICLREVLIEYLSNESLIVTLRMAIEQIVKWKLLNDITVHLMESICEEAAEEWISVLMSDGLVSYIKNDFNYDIRVHMLGYCNVPDMVRNGEVDVTALSRKGRTALHIATKCNATDTMEYLLDCGFNPNIRDENGKTPIFKVFGRKDPLMLLLLHGADLQASDNSGGTMLDYFTSPNIHWDFDFLKIVAAHLAVLQSNGVALTEPFHHYIFGLEELLNHFLTCCQQIEKMKKHKVHSSLTLFEILTESIENLTRRVRPLDRKAIETFLYNSSAQGYDSYYISASRERLEKAVTISNLRDKAVTVLGDSVEILKPYYLVLDRICSFLTYYDLQVFEEP